MAFCSIQENFIRNVRAKFCIPYSSQSPDIGQISDRDISDFRISDQSLIKSNCQNSRSSDDIGRKLRPVTKLDKKNKTTWKKIDDNVMPENCNIIDIFPIYGQFAAIPRLDSGRIVSNTYIFINSNFLSYKNWKQN